MIITATQARANLFELIEQAGSTHKPIQMADVHIMAANATSSGN